MSDQKIDGLSLGFTDSKEIRIPLMFSKIEWREGDFVFNSVQQRKTLVEAYIKSVDEKLKLENAKLKTIIESELQQFKSDVESSRLIVSQIGIPVRKTTQVPNTFLVPIERKRIIPSKSKRREVELFEPEYLIDDLTYKGILEVTHNFFRETEKLPSTYQGKQEEDLRDHVLVHLQSHFEGTVTGETFNKSGKTDILFSYEGNNVFVAELKFWRGPKSLHDTLSQLLSYLTWRDSKAAAVIFVDNKKISDVLEKVKTETSKHQNFLRCLFESQEGWYNYCFHLNGDEQREIQVAVMLFHLPK